MKDHSVLHVRRRAVVNSTPQPAKRRTRLWAISLVVFVLIGIVGISAVALRGNYAPAAVSVIIPAAPHTGGGNLDSPNLNRSLGFNAYNSAPGTTTEDQSAQAQSWDRMIIRVANMGLTVNDVLAAADRVKSLAVQHGGHVFSSESHQQGEYTYATITVYVPAQEFDQVMPALRKLDGQVQKVTSENVTSSDVTEEYTDLQSQLRNLQATEARMLDLQSKASVLADVLAIDRELRTVQGDIERIQGRINFLNKRNEMSTISLQLSPVAAPVAQDTSAWQPFEAAVGAWNASLDVLGKIGTALVTVGVFMWWIVPLALIALWLMARARRKPVVVATES